MSALRELPGNYRLAWALDLKHNLKMGILLQLLATVALFPLWWLFATLATWIHPQPGFWTMVLDSALWVIVTLIPVIVLHELVHGAFFWYFSGARPKFGVGWGYAYAAAPDWYFKKRNYLVVGLAPLVGISLAGAVFIALTPVSWAPALVSAMLLNASGAMGDVYICWRIARETEDAWVRDTGDGFEIFRPVDG